MFFRSQADLKWEGPQLRVLVVDDEELNLKYVSTLLSHMGLLVDCAQNGFEALKLFPEKIYDVILMDIQMPEMDGIETTKKIRNLKENKERPPYIIALTAFALEQELNNLIKLGFNSYLAKPLDVQHLHYELNKFTKTHCVH